MLKKLFWILISPLSLACASASIVQRDPVSWSLEQCSSNYLLVAEGLIAPPLECATISVPLDYNDTSKGTISLQMARIPATQQPSKGGIFFNPGGPGGPGTAFMAGSGPMLVEKLGPDWDFISWDPRSIGGSEPFIQGLTLEEKFEIWGETTHPGQFESYGNLTTDEDADFFRGYASIIDEGLQKLDEAFKSKNGDNLTYIGTTANVRDIVTMANALYGEDTDINFYGISYGTYIGMMLTQMFPDRIGKVFLDGVVNPQANSQYVPILGLDEELGDAPEVLRGFYNTCALSGPDQCALAAQYPTADAMEEAINQFFDRTRQTWSNPQLPSYNAIVVQGLFPALYNPSSWLQLAEGFVLALNGSLDEGTALVKPKVDETRKKWPWIPTGHLNPLWNDGWKRSLDARQQFDNVSDGYSWAGNYTLVTIQCSDSVEMDLDIVTTERIFEETIRISRTVWPLAASIIYSEHFCHRYTSRAVERYSGPWDVQPKNVVLVLGNQADPITPCRNAQLVTRLLGKKARLIQQAGYGHSTYSTCTTNVLQQYLQGTIPGDKGDDGPDVFCAVDQGPFGLPGDTPWNITTSQNGDKLTAGPYDPGLVNFPGLNPPPAVGGQGATNSSLLNDAVERSKLAWWPPAFVLGLGVLVA
ncbi:hypothetical protein CPB86DRAFT_787541 [Serendipita vermifera]|nr:hypothetical protein CPB86DRAFT_787541 [Serendipita vermifera]